ncbi:LacI family DNA-binding transcriptional regulator [Macrococcus bovicus]|uniref:LacI family transcriptional regulator n=1 Tax=Macrococcus bovicus TaxID=69968 RepID=A0A4R6C0H7_9STAP|nr:LacI family DNA-binding transcriptional regulator [Macrococcus bovicus]TDM14332.1 LacI family transcriptional regulator [Macrococcus bovicus]
MATIKDVAEYSGVSVATVSRAVNNSGYVHEDTRKKIDAAIKALNYRPNETARSLYNKKSKIIGLLLPDISNPFFTLVARGVEDAALQRGYHIIIGNSDQNVEKESRYIETFKVNNCAGFISSTLQMIDASQYISNLGMAHVTLDRTDDTSFAVEADHYKGGRLQATHLVEQGCRRLLVVYGNQKFSSFKKRFEGARDALGEFDVEFDAVELASDEIDESLMTQLADYDGLICYNDLVAIQLLGLLQRYGQRVPDDIQVVGYDDILISSHTYPSLTTIHQPAYRLGRIACDQLIALLNDEKIDRYMSIDVHLIARESTRSEKHE